VKRRGFGHADSNWFWEGHDFSRAENGAVEKAALAAEGWLKAEC
jgi:hypothetical protein